MILPFSTQMNGKPTYFVEKIWKGLSGDLILNKVGYPSEVYPKEYLECLQKELVNYENKLPKLHTFREDKKDRWKPGTKIDFFINCRQKNMFRFAPVLPVVSTQKVEIKWIPLTRPLGERRPWVRIDGKNIFTIDHFITEEMTQLALNDGFDNVEDFFAYFNEDFTGKIIHWTDLRY
jgi:hypothetical protein